MSSRKSDLRRHRAARRKWGRQQCIVYLLKDSDGIPRYVGQTRSLLSERLRNHLKVIATAIASGRRLSPAQQWINAMWEAGTLPTIEPLDEAGQWDITEAVWIDRLRQRGAPLLNVASVVPDRVV